MSVLDVGLDERLAEQALLRELARDGGKGTLAVDFDDTLTADGGVAACVELRRRGYGLIVFTANAGHDDIRAWLRARWPTDDEPPPVVDRKPQALAFIDDKAVVFDTWSAILDRFA